MDNAMKNVVILATGGTIAGAGEQGKDIGYKSGAIEAKTLVDAVPGLKDLANIRVEQFCNINSDDVTSEIWILLALRIKELLAQDDVDGIVVMHGTDTMEETAFFLSLVLNASETAAKPVILTGSMRPATAAEPDGPANLLFAVQTAVSPYTVIPDSMSPRIYSGAGSPLALSSRPCAGAGSTAVYVAFAGKLMDARSVQKVHANDLDAFASPQPVIPDSMSSRPCAGTGSPSSMSPRTCSGVAFSYSEAGSPFASPSHPAFDISNLRELPRVPVLYFNADADAELVRFAAERSAGLVIAGAGAGEFSKSWAKVIADVVAEKNIPVVISTRINRGRIVPEQLLVPGTIAAYGLPPAKAAVLLRLALTITNNPAEIQEFFLE